MEDKWKKCSALKVSLTSYVSIWKWRRKRFPEIHIFTSGRSPVPVQLPNPYLQLSVLVKGLPIQMEKLVIIFPKQIIQSGEFYLWQIQKHYPVFLTLRRPLFHIGHVLETQLWCKTCVCVWESIISLSLCPDTEETAANEAAGGGNKAVHWQPEGRGAKLCTTLADGDAERIRQKKQLEQVRKQTKRYRDSKTQRERDVEKREDWERVGGRKGLLKGSFLASLS